VWYDVDGYFITAQANVEGMAYRGFINSSPQFGLLSAFQFFQVLIQPFLIVVFHQRSGEHQRQAGNGNQKINLEVIV
jgi:hypothetical protein